MTSESTPAASVDPAVVETDLEEAIRLCEVGEYLYSARAYSYGDGYTEPREYGIEWQWQQSKPNEFGQGVLLAEVAKWHADRAEDGIVTEATKLRAMSAALASQAPAVRVAREGGFFDGVNHIPASLELGEPPALATPSPEQQPVGNSDELNATPTRAEHAQVAGEVGGLVEANAYLAALLDYSGGFYGAAIAHGMRAGPAADAVAHVERAARNLYALCKADAGRIEALTAEVVALKEHSRLRALDIVTLGGEVAARDARIAELEFAKGVRDLFFKKELVAAEAALAAMKISTDEWQERATKAEADSEMFIRMTNDAEVRAMAADERAAKLEAALAGCRGEVERWKVGLASALAYARALLSILKERFPDEVVPEWIGALKDAALQPHKGSE